MLRTEIEKNQSNDSLDALEIYRIINEITKSGCDVEVKLVNGILKVYKIQKKASKEFQVYTKNR